MAAIGTVAGRYLDGSLTTGRVQGLEERLDVEIKVSEYLPPLPPVTDLSVSASPDVGFRRPVTEQRLANRIP